MKDFTAIRHSFAPASRIQVSSSAPGRPIRNGDRIHVRLTRVQPGSDVIADFILSEVKDLSDIYGELRYHTRGLHGLTNLSVRNITRGWAFTQPFMLYADTRRVAVSVAHPQRQPQAATSRLQHDINGRRILPESISLLFGDH